MFCIILDPDSRPCQADILREKNCAGKDRTAGVVEDELLGVGNEQFGGAMTRSEAFYGVFFRVNISVQRYVEYSVCLTL